MVFTLTDNEELYAQYPRHFVFQICYRLAENTIQITFKVENRDEKTMYFGLGGHPGFCVPMEEGDSFTDYRLRFAPCKPKRVDFTEKCLLFSNAVISALYVSFALYSIICLFDVFVLKAISSTSRNFYLIIPCIQKQSKFL